MQLNQAEIILNLHKYLVTLNEAVDLEDSELIGYLVKKIAGVLQIGPVADFSSLNQNAIET